MEIKLLRGDCLELLKDIPDEGFEYTYVFGNPDASLKKLAVGDIVYYLM